LAIQVMREKGKGGGLYYGLCFRKGGRRRAAGNHHSAGNSQEKGPEEKPDIRIPTHLVGGKIRDEGTGVIGRFR